MSKLAFLAATVLGAVLCAAGCASQVTMADAPDSLPAGVAAPRVPLTACFVPDSYKTLLSGRRYAVAQWMGGAGGVFAVEKADFDELDADCDVKVVVNTMNSNADVYAARSGKGIVSLKRSFGANPLGKLRAALMTKFNDPALIDSVRAERPGAVSGPAAAGPGNLDDAGYDRMRAAAGMPPERRGPVSDVDSPSRRAAERPDDFALLIGIEQYQSLPKADHGERDAKTVRRHLEALGFPPRNIVSLEGSGATKSKLESYLKEWLPLNVKPSSTLFVYYSGHGAPDPKSGDAYLVPWDGDPKFLKSTAYPLAQLYADLSKTKAERVVVALDACFSGAGGRSVLAQGARPLVAKVADIAAGERVTVLAAASGDEITGTLEEQGHGLFTYHLLKGLSADPKVSARALHSYLLPRVQDDARRQNREQTPTLAGASLDAPLLP